jgi:hypothetical protein
MKAHLMYGDRDFDLDGQAPPLAAALTQDLELSTLFAAMAAGDAYLLNVATKAVLTSLTEPDAIIYRQHILADCQERASIVREMYAIAVEAIEGEKKVWGWSSERYPQGALDRSVRVLDLLVGLLRKLRRLGDQHGGEFRSKGFTTLFTMLSTELNDEYLGIVATHLRRLKLRDGLLMSAELDRGNQGTHYVLRRPLREKSWMERLIDWVKEALLLDRSGYTYRIPDRDESGFKALDELRNQGVGIVASALAQSTEHVLSFFNMLRLELGFYVGCLNLRDRLKAKGEPTCFPEPLPFCKPVLRARDMYDLCLSLSVKERVVGNEVSAAEKSLVMITGANRGGKSTFLRSIGVAQLLMQCGMFVPAESFCANVRDRIFTHFKRAEDASMNSGKLDEELSRMSALIDNLTPNSMVLFNESFASTNEREGSEISRQIVRALLEKGIKVFYVTHLFDLAHGFYVENANTALFLRAERLTDAKRTFRLIEGEPLPTSYGEDLYHRIFDGGHDASTAHTGACYGDDSHASSR